MTYGNDAFKGVWTHFIYVYHDRRCYVNAHDKWGVVIITDEENVEGFRENVEGFRGNVVVLTFLEKYEFWNQKIKFCPEF